MNKFERENRYIVIKRKDVRAMDHRTSAINSPGFSGAGAATSKTATEKLLDDMAAKTRNENNKPPLGCLVIESDWPEYEPVWQMIQDRTDGRERQALHSGLKLVPIEPTAEMLKAAYVDYESDQYTGPSSMYKAMLSATPDCPQPAVTQPEPNLPKG